MKIDGKNFYGMVLSGANALSNRQEEVNQLNVFPVPDGDTGLNMSMTLAGIKQISCDGDALPETAKKIANAVLRSARGNSGAILSLFFRGFSKSLASVEEASCIEIASAFRKGTDEAYKAVMKPAEGTILTVMRRSAEEAEKVSAQYGDDVEGFLRYIGEVAQTTLDETPEMLPVLKEAGVVDAGGCGFTVMLTGMLSYLEGKPVAEESVATASAAPERKNAANFSEFSTEDIRFAYCTECIVEKKKSYRGEDKATKLGNFIRSIGDSVVFVDTEDIIKLHVHTNNPGEVLEQALRYGSLLTVKIENMKSQHSALSDGADMSKKDESPVGVPIEKSYGFVSICVGDGIKSTFADLGVDEIITGGQTMNPSTQDILDAILKTPAETVFVLPNNKNIFLAAAQAAELTEDRKVVMLETKTVPQGISALMAFDETASVEENVEAMKKSIGNVTTISVTYAVRNTTVEGMPIRKGQKLGLVNGKIRCVTDHTGECVLHLTEYMEHAAFVTIFYGESVSEEKAERMLESLREKLGYDKEYVMIPGGQPLYDYIIAAEV